MGGRLGRQGAGSLAALAIGVAIATGPGCVSHDGAQGAADGGTPDASGDDAEGGVVQTPSGEGGIASMSLDSTSLMFPSIPCGGSPSTLPLHVTNGGSGMLAVSATTVGAGFSLTPSVLQVPAGGTGVLSVTAVADAMAIAGPTLSGSLELFTNDPANAHMSVALAGNPSGPVLSFATTSSHSLNFPTTEVNNAAPQAGVVLVNSGNAPGTFTIGPPSDHHFSFYPATDGGPQTITIPPGGTYNLSAGFTPTNASPVGATAVVTASGSTCAGSLLDITFSGQGALGVVSGWPTTIDFGPASCGGAAPATQSFTLSNTGLVPATVTSVQITGTAGFTTDLRPGRVIAAGGTHPVALTAPAVPQFAPLTPITATLSIQTDADTSPHVITLTEEPSGAVLAFDTHATTGFGSFGPVVLLRGSTEGFNVVNNGNAPANVSLQVTSTEDGDAGGTGPFQVSSPTFTVSGTTPQAEVVTFTPTSALPVTGQISLTATGAICGTLPAPLSLSGSGIGGAPTIAPTSLAFNASCGGAAPPSQSFLVTNAGSADMNWSLGPVTGVGAAQYSVQASPPPGLLHPGATSTVIVTASAVPSPAPNPSPAAYAAQLTITTDVPYDPPHVVTLGETPLGDQLAFSGPTPVRFGQVPVNTSLQQSFTLVNASNPGSPPASVQLQLSGTGASGYSLSPGVVNALAAGGHTSSPETVTFSPTSAVPYSASVALVTGDALCTPLPAALGLSGSGTQAVVSLSATTLTFGSDPSDPAGLVNCGATGLAKNLTIANLGNQALKITGLALGKGTASPFSLSSGGVTTIGIGQATTISISPSPIPATVANPNDPSPFTDALTVTTDAAMDAPHVVKLVMQARGAVIASTPLTADWTFGTVAAGGIATFTNTIQNLGNSPAIVALQGVKQSTIFGIANNPTTVAPNAVASVVGQFTPPSADGVWSDQGTLVVSAVQAFCAPVPAAWSNAAIALSGTSNSAPAVTLSGSLTFPTTDCGGGSPAGQAVVLTNATGGSVGYTAKLSSGRYYSVTASGGTVPGNGAASVVVTPNAILPGPGVQPGSAPYADNLVLTVATSPPTTFTVPVAWALNGAILTLPQGAGPNLDGQGKGYYLADSTTGFPFLLANTGTATASVSVAIQPFGLFSLTPADPISVSPGLGASPEFVSSPTAPACDTTASGTMTFLYSGPVCQPLPLASVKVQACAGTY